MNDIFLPNVAQLPERILRNVPSRNYLLDARNDVVDAAVDVAVELWRKINPAPASSEPLEWENGHLWIGLV